MLPEITSPTNLVTPEGRLKPAAVGWGRAPFADTSRLAGGRGRNKRWEYWNVTTPTHILALTVSSIDYAAVHEVWVFDRATERTWSKSVTLVPARGVQLASTLGDGPTHARARGLEIDIDEVPRSVSAPAATRVRARIADASFDVLAEFPEGHERLAVVVPWSSTRFQYTVKDVARPASGTLTIEGRSFDVPAGESWAVLDHGRGRWPYDATWNWGAGSGTSGGRVIGIQVGGRWTAGTGSTENAVLIEDRLHYLPEELVWEYTLENWRAPWRVSGCGLEASFRPFYNKRTRTNLGIVSGRTDQCFGYWSGTFTRAPGDVVEFADILGWAEEVHNRW